MATFRLPFIVNVRLLLDEVGEDGAVVGGQAGTGIGIAGKFSQHLGTLA